MPSAAGANAHVRTGRRAGLDAYEKSISNRLVERRVLRSARALNAEGQTDAQLLIRAERRVWRKMKHLERLPFYLIYGSLAILHFTTRSKLVLICLLYAYPTLLLPATLLACRWVDWMEPREAQQRWEYERLRGRQRRS